MTGDGAASAAIPKLLLQKETGFRDFNFCGLLNTAFNALKDIATDPKEKDKKIAEFKRSIEQINTQYKRCLDMVEETRGMGLSEEEYNEKVKELTEKIQKQKESLRKLSSFKVFASKVPEGVQTGAEKAAEHDGEKEVSERQGAKRSRDETELSALPSATVEERTKRKRDAE